MRRRETDIRVPPLALVVGLVLVLGAGGLWLAWLVGELAAPVSSAGHHDFFAFYAAAQLIRAHQAASLYSAATLTGLERHIYPHPTGYAGYMPFLNPPAAAMILSPLASLPFATARLVVVVINVALAITCALLITSGRDVRIRALAVVLALLAFPTYQTLVEGQWSLLMLFGCLAALIAARRGHGTLAGFCLVVLWLKPPLLLLVLVWLLLTRRWRIAGTAVAGVVALTLVTLPITGVDANVAYARYLVDVTSAHVAGGGAAGQTAWEGALPNMEGLIGLAATIVGQTRPVLVDALTAVLGVVLIIIVAWAMRGHWRDERLPLSLLLAAVALGLLLDPHLYAQDCVLLLVMVALVLGRVERGARRVDAAVLIASALLLDLAAIDTLWIQGMFPLPLHLLTGVLIAMVLAAAWRRRNVVERLA